MLDILKLATVPLTVLLLLVFLRMLFRGPQVVTQLSRSGFSLRTWLTGTGLRDDAGSTTRSGYGLVMRINRDKAGLTSQVEVGETINLSSPRL